MRPPAARALIPFAHRLTHLRGSAGAYSRGAPTRGRSGWAWPPPRKIQRYRRGGQRRTRPVKMGGGETQPEWGLRGYDLGRPGTGQERRKGDGAPFRPPLVVARTDSALLRPTSSCASTRRRIGSLPAYW